MTPTLRNAARLARGGLLTVANGIGVNRQIGSSNWRRRRLLILCYHGVSIDDEHEWSDLYVSPALLERRLKLLKEANATVLPLREALELLREGRLPRCAVSLTFDDGSCDFALQAAPRLESAGVPATLFLTTYYCGVRHPVFDTITSYLLWKGRGKSIVLPGTSSTVTIPESSASDRFQQLHAEIKSYAARNKFDTLAKEALVRSLAKLVGQDYDAILERRLLQLMTPDEVGALDTRTIDVQLHTHRHRLPHDRDAFLGELHENANAIRRFTGSDAKLDQFCYPSGEYEWRHRDWLLGAGVQYAVTCDPALVDRSSDHFFLPRLIDFEARSDASFLSWVSGLNTFTHSSVRVGSP